MNKGLTTEIEEIEHLLPTRKNTSTKELKMSAVTTSWTPENKFNFEDKKLSQEETRKVIARVVEVATRTLFENHMYRFGGQVYRQENGGSIGDRWTGSAAEIVMQDWSEQYQKILDNSGLVTLLLAGYVDDGRQATTVLPMGSRYDEKANKFISTPEGELEDKKKQAEGESCNKRMARVCQKAMNSINPNYPGLFL